PMLATRWLTYLAGTGVTPAGIIDLARPHTPFLSFHFSGNPRGAQASATLYTLVETAKANNREPWGYLNHLFEKLPAAKSEKALLELLPQNLKMKDLKR
ncbi:MAG: transposase domain-containing protein, partial [Candidatus Thiodiazotropha sp. (ex Lucinoma kastoroae)]|nr:transposase domain-containing protein [Candidatus Thiodiazotropha sp. (ex Lucinoma kastoroae)]